MKQVKDVQEFISIFSYLQSMYRQYCKMQAFYFLGNKKTTNLAAKYRREYTERYFHLAEKMQDEMISLYSTTKVLVEPKLEEIVEIDFSNLEQEIKLKTTGEIKK